MKRESSIKIDEINQMRRTIDQLTNEYKKA